MDILGDVLLSIRLLASSIATFEFAGDWGISMSKNPANFVCCYTVVEGPCWFESEGLQATRLEVGDSVMFLNGIEHRYMSEKDVHLEEFIDIWTAQGLPSGPPTPGKSRSAPVRMTWGEGQCSTRLLGLAFFVEKPAYNPLLSELPSTLLVRKTAVGLFPWLPSTLAFLSDETASTTPGYIAAQKHLAELIFTSFIRAHVVSTPAIKASWLRGLSDPRIGRALVCIHGRPEERWTAESLAKEAGMARSSFARRFAELTGQSPIDYLIGWRMLVASERLSQDKQSVARVAESLGYQSERWFRQAFKAHFGTSPLRHIKNQKTVSPLDIRKTE